MTSKWKGRGLYHQPKVLAPLRTDPFNRAQEALALPGDSVSTFPAPFLSQTDWGRCYSYSQLLNWKIQVGLPGPWANEHFVGLETHTLESSLRGHRHSSPWVTNRHEFVFWDTAPALSCWEAKPLFPYGSRPYHNGCCSLEESNMLGPMFGCAVGNPGAHVSVDLAS